MIPRVMTTLALIALIASPLCATEVEKADTTMLNELVVTAIKQSQRLNDLPLASTLVTEAQTERLGITTIRGVSDVVPNFYIPDYGSRITSSIYVRGIGARMDQPSVGLNVDNVGFLNKDAYDFDIADIISVQMLRGPQSTLYGRNTMGGQINITTLSAFDYQGLRLMGQIGNGLEGKINVGYYKLLRDDMGLAVTGGYTYSAGWFKNLYNGKKTDKESLLSGRIKYNWRPTNIFSLQNTLALSNLRQGGYPYQYVPNGRIEYNDTCFYRRFCLNDGLTMKLTLDDVALSSISSVQYINDNMTLDQDFLPLSYFTLTQKKQEWALTQDFVAKRRGDHKYMWTLGAYGFYKHLNMQAPVTFLDDGISQLIEKHRNDALPNYPIEWDSRVFPLDSRFQLPNYGLSVYHESHLHLGSFDIYAGLRLDYEHTRLSYRSICNGGYTIYHEEEGSREPFKHIDININDGGRLSDHFIQLLPKIGVVYNLNDDSNLYASVSKGYKAGGFNTQMFSDILQQRIMGLMGIGSKYDVRDIVNYKPEKSWNYEVGVHMPSLTEKFGIEVSLFYIDCRDQQLTMFPDGTTTGRIMTNAGKTRSFGGELQASLRNVGAFSFNVSYGYTNARFTRFFDGINDYKGKYLPYAPQNTIFAQALYVIAPRKSFFDKVEFDVNMRATGKIYWNEGNTLSQPMYALLNASVTFEKGDFSLRLWGDNLTGTHYNTFYFVSIGNEFLQKGRPLRFGATLRMNLNI